MNSVSTGDEAITKELGDSRLRIEVKIVFQKHLLQLRLSLPHGGILFYNIDVWSCSSIVKDNNKTLSSQMIIKPTVWSLPSISTDHKEAVVVPN